MRISLTIVILATVGFFSCKQASKSAPDTVDIETSDSVKPVENDKSIYTKYEYADSMGKRLIINNSLPRGGRYIDPNGKKHAYAVFYTRISNETNESVELKIDLPPGSFEFPLSSGNYMKLFVPSYTMTHDKASLTDYGLPIKSFLDTAINRSYSVTRNVDTKESTAFYVVIMSDNGVDGILRTGLSLKGQNLFYKISAYKSIPRQPLIDEKEIKCGSINLKNLTLQE